MGKPLRHMRTGASSDLNAYEETIPAMFCNPDRSPKVVALAESEVMLLVVQAGTKIAGVNACFLGQLSRA